MKISRIVKSVEYAREALMKVEEPELATFLELMGSLEQDLRQIGCEKLSMEKDLLLIYERLSAETNFTSQVSEQSDSHARIMRRLHSRNTG